MNEHKLQQLDCSLSGDTQLSLVDFSSTLKNWERSHQQGLRFSYFLVLLPANHQSLTYFLSWLAKSSLFLITKAQTTLSKTLRSQSLFCLALEQ